MSGQLSRRERRALARRAGGQPPAGGVERRESPERRELTITQMESVTRSGPLPDAEELAKYDAVHAGAAALILQKFADQTDHRRELERVVVTGNDRRSNRGQWMAFILGMTTILGGIFLAYSGKETAGLVAVVGALGSLLLVFISGRSKQRKEIAEKSQAGRR